MVFKEGFCNILVDLLKDQLDKQQILSLIEKPKQEKMGDLSFPCFELAKFYRKSPQIIAGNLADQIQSPLFEKVENAGGYVNVFLNKQMVTEHVIKDILNSKEHYGDWQFGNGEIITMDLSSPNIAKPFSMGHLRSTVIGNAIALLAEKCGFKTVRINHLGDWGTQFGKLIVAYKTWGSDAQLKSQPIKELLKLYVRFHEEADLDPTLLDQGREWFKKLEEGDHEALSLWKWFRDESLEEFRKIYDLLGVDFDSYDGEAFYNDKMETVVDMLAEKKLLIESDGAKVVCLEDQGMPPCLIKKSDGTTLYATRDLAAALYRYQTYQFSKSLYVVGHEQSLHFKQLEAVLEKMEVNWANTLVHIPFGMILKDGKKMSTRKGKLVLLEDVLNDAIQMAMSNILEKNPNLDGKEEIARQVGTGAVIFHDLKHYRLNDFEFSLVDMLKFEGDTGPYVQYTHARLASLLKKGSYSAETQVLLKDLESAWPMVVQLMGFPDTVKRAFEEYNPSLIAKYVLDLSKFFNKYYATVRILEEDGQKEGRLAVVFAVKTVLKEGLRVLGLEAPEEM